MRNAISALIGLLLTGNAMAYDRQPVSNLGLGGGPRPSAPQISEQEMNIRLEEFMRKLQAGEVEINQLREFFPPAESSGLEETMQPSGQYPSVDMYGKRPPPLNVPPPAQRHPLKRNPWDY